MSTDLMMLIPIGLAGLFIWLLRSIGWSDKRLAKTGLVLGGFCVIGGYLAAFSIVGFVLILVGIALFLTGLGVWPWREANR
jgi:hypothetical protein